LRCVLEFNVYHQFIRFVSGFLYNLCFHTCYTKECQKVPGFASRSNKRIYQYFFKFYFDASRCVFLYHKQMKICRPTQHFSALSHIATCFGSHEPSSGTSFYNSLKHIGTFEHAVILSVRCQ
jgi:hypothetical protein